MMSYLDEQGHLNFTDAEVASFEAILAEHRAGEGRSSTWLALKRRLKRDFSAGK
jgi:hypothetical protein